MNTKYIYDGNRKGGCDNVDIFASLRRSYNKIGNNE